MTPADRDDLDGLRGRMLGLESRMLGLERTSDSDRTVFGGVLESIDANTKTLLDLVGRPPTTAPRSEGSGLCREVAETKAETAAVRTDLKEHMKEEEALRREDNEKRRHDSETLAKVVKADEADRTGQLAAVVESKKHWTRWAVGVLVTVAVVTPWVAIITGVIGRLLGKW